MKFEYNKPIYLEKFHKRSVEILVVIDEFCKKNQIKYFLIGGTLLGAIHFNGFIPWDDDIDIGMLREDYEKFINLWQDTDTLQLLNHLKYEDYPLLYSKVSDRRSVVESSGFSKELSFTQGVFVDIIPFDYMEESYHKAVKVQKAVKFWNVILRNKKIKIATKGNFFTNIIVTFVRIISSLIHRLYGRERIIKIINKKLFHEKGEYFVDYLQPGELKKEIFPTQFVENLIEWPFEQYHFPIVSEYKKAIKIQYGEEFSQPPLEEIEQGFHGFSYIEIDNVKYIEDGRPV
ncbi:LicD family protein [Lactococcus taiwanensis]|uniref:LicD family protein n=1 Tax=Lactococcus taiwanensis TaxID=1151742 RepID=UPI00289AB7A4|nr:LicD family protein [Lactococcus taiwanensis]